MMTSMVVSCCHGLPRQSRYHDRAVGPSGCRQFNVIRPSTDTYELLMRRLARIDSDSDSESE